MPRDPWTGEEGPDGLREELKKLAEVSGRSYGAVLTAALDLCENLLQEADKHMLIDELARDVHENAVAHGWWDETRSTEEIIALIHSEWSEALEEARAGRPLAYIDADTSDGLQNESRLTRIERGVDGRYIHCGKECHGKPEGIAVELMDGCIRILDYLGWVCGTFVDGDGTQTTIESLYAEGNVQKVPDKIPELIALLHLYTAFAMAAHPIIAPDSFRLLEAMAAAMSWVKKRGIDPLALLMEKHKYNRTRPYKHGKKF